MKCLLTLGTNSSFSPEICRMNFMFWSPERKSKKEFRLLPLSHLGLLQQTATDWVVKNNRKLFFTVLELGSSNSGYQQGQCLGESMSSWLHIAGSLYPHPPMLGRGGAHRSPFLGALIPRTRTRLFMTSSLPKGPTSEHLHIGPQNFTMNLRNMNIPSIASFKKLFWGDGAQATVMVTHLRSCNRVIQTC